MLSVSLIQTATGSLRLQDEVPAHFCLNPHIFCSLYVSILYDTLAGAGTGLGFFGLFFWRLVVFSFFHLVDVDDFELLSIMVCILYNADYF